MSLLLDVIVQLNVLILLEAQFGTDLRNELERLLGLITDNYLARSTLHLHLLCDVYSFTEDVVSHEFAAYDSSDNLTSVDANSHVESIDILGLFGEHLLLCFLTAQFNGSSRLKYLPNISTGLRCRSDIIDDFDHLKTSLDDSGGLINNHGFVSLILIDSTIVTHNNIRVTDSMNLVDSLLFTELIEPGKYSRKEDYDFFWVALMPLVLSKVAHVGEKKSAVRELINHLSFFVLDDGQNVIRNELSNQSIGQVDLHI